MIAVTGGFRIELGPVRISSRNSSRVFLLALVSLAIAWRLAYVAQLEAWIQRYAGRVDRKAGAIAWGTAALFLMPCPALLRSFRAEGTRLA